MTAQQENEVLATVLDHQVTRMMLSKLVGDSGLGSDFISVITSMLSHRDSFISNNHKEINSSGAHYKVRKSSAFLSPLFYQQYTEHNFEDLVALAVEHKFVLSLESAPASLANLANVYLPVEVPDDLASNQSKHWMVIFLDVAQKTMYYLNPLSTAAGLAQETISVQLVLNQCAQFLQDLFGALTVPLQMAATKKYDLCYSEWTANSVTPKDTGLIAITHMYFLAFGCPIFLNNILLDNARSNFAHWIINAGESSLLPI